MILLIIISVISTLIGIYFTVKRKSKKKHKKIISINYIELFLNLIPIYFLSGFIYLIIICVGRSNLYNKNFYYEYKDLKITSLIQDEEYKTSGSFFLGCGSIQGKEYDYYITYGQFNSGLKRIKIDAFSTYLKETDSELPRIKDYWVREVNGGYKSLWFWNEKPYTGMWNENNNNNNLILIVPKKTLKIIDEYNIDH